LIVVCCLIILAGFIIISNKKDEVISMKIAKKCQASECDEIISESVSVEIFNQKIDSGDYIIIDIRTEMEHEKERIADMQNNIDIFSEDFDKELNKLDKNKKYLIYCHSGSRTKMGLQRMRTLGFDEVYELEGGIVAWKIKNLPVVLNK